MACEPFIAELESRAQPYLFKLRQTQGVKRLLARQFARDDWSVPGPSDQGWSAVEDTLKLSGWDKARRVVVLRRSVKADLALSRKTRNEPGEQIELLMPDKDVQAWEYAVLVASFITEHVTPFVYQQEKESRHHDAIVNQTIGEGLQAYELEKLSRYETHLDRKFERTLAMLIKLKDLRSSRAA